MSGRLAFAAARLRVPAPRLLPATMLALAALLSVRSAHLVLAALPATGEHPAAASPSLGATAAPPIGHDADAPGAGAPRPPGGAMAVPAIKPASGTTAPAASPPPSPPQAAPAAAPPSAAEPPPVSEAERKLLQELRQRRLELDQRDAALAAREGVLAAAEHKLGQRVDELQALQQRLETLEAAREQREEAGWQGLVKTYEAMKPRDAAAIFNEMDMPVLLQVVDRMKDTKAASVLAAMRVDKARELTEQLAQMRARRNTPGGEG